ncbi:MAG: hypothetical protein QW680_05715 [Pyrobaculum sp.]
MRWALFLTAVAIAVLVAAALWAGVQPRGASGAVAVEGPEAASTTAQPSAALPPQSGEAALRAEQSPAPGGASADASLQGGFLDNNKTAPGASARGSEENRRRAREWGPPTLVNLKIAVYGFEKIYAAYRAVEMDYFKKPKRNDTVVRTFGVLDEEARREFMGLDYNSSAGVVEFVMRNPFTVTPGEFMSFVERLRGELPVGDVYFASRLEYAVLVARKNATTAEGPAVNILVLDDEDFRRFTKKYVGYEVDPCDNSIVLPSYYNRTFAKGQVVEAFLPLAWYGVRTNTARAYFHVNMLLKIHFTSIYAEEPHGYIGKCFAESFTDVPPYKSYAIVEVPKETWLYVHWKREEFINEMALQRPERIEWLARWYREPNATRDVEFIKRVLEEARKRLEELRAELGLS